MYQGQQPRRRLRPFRHEGVRASPRSEEPLLDGVLRERLVTKDPQCETVRDPAEAVVQLRERLLVRASDEGDDGLVGQMRESTRHGRRSLAHPAGIRPAQASGSGDTVLGSCGDETAAWPGPRGCLAHKHLEQTRLVRRFQHQAS